MGSNSRYAIRGVRGRYLELPDHPQTCELPDLKEYTDGLQGPLAVDLFCGAGGTSLGLEMAGFHTIMGADLDEPSLATHRANFGGASVRADLSLAEDVDRVVHALDGISVDLLAASPPCQPFSPAGRGKMRALARGEGAVVDQRKELWRGMIDVVSRIMPRAVMVENVPGMTWGDNIAIVAGIVEGLEELGFDVYARLLPARQYRVPQFRERIFIVGVERGMAFEWPAPDGETTLEDAIADLPPVEGGSYTESIEYAGPRTAFQTWARGGVDEEGKHLVHDHFTRAVREDDLEAFRLMDHRTKYSDLPEHLRRYRSDIFDDKYKRLSWNDVSRTITAHIAKDGYWYIHPEQHRTLTMREAARIQTFPDWFRFAGFPSNALRQIGNAVPPLLGAAVGGEIFRALGNPERQRVRLSSRELGTILATWMQTQQEDELAQPWRRSDDLWHTLLGIILFEKAKPVAARNFWPTYARRWKTPQAYLEDPRREAATRAIGRGGTGELLTRLARALSGPEDPLEPGAVRIPGLSRERIAYAATLSGSARSFQPTLQTDRITRRVFGRSNQGSKTRDVLSMVRLIGDSHSGQAYGALLEVGDRFCLPSEPRCHSCPLRVVCKTGQKSAEAHPVLFAGQH